MRCRGKLCCCEREGAVAGKEDPVAEAAAGGWWWCRTELREELVGLQDLENGNNSSERGVGLDTQHQPRWFLHRPSSRHLRAAWAFCEYH